MNAATTALTDQLGAAFAEANAAVARLAEQHGTVVTDARAHPVAARLARDLQARLLFGGVGQCRHVGPSPHVLAWPVWRPERLLCLPCAQQEQRQVRGTVEDQTCDGCRVVVNRIHPGALAVGPVLVLCGLWGCGLEELVVVETPTVDAEAEAMGRAAAFADDVAHEEHRLRVREAARVKAQLRALPLAEPLIVGALPRRAYVVLRGRDHSFKSFVALDWACCLATGKAWQGRPVERVRVLYIAGEGAYGIASRVDAWEHAWGHTVDPEWLTVRSAALNMYAPGAAFDDLLERVEAGRYGFVLVDTLRRVSGRADGNGSDMGAVVDNLDRIKLATDDGSVAAVAHTDKGDNDSRGYSGIEDDADVVWHARRNDMHLALELTKSKDGPDGATLQLQARPSLTSLVLGAATGAPVSTTESQIAILDTMRELFREGVHSGTLMKATGLAETTFYRALGELRDAGHMVRTGSKRAPFYELADQ